MVKIPVGSETFKLPDGHRLIELTAAAARFARMVADAAADGGEGVPLPDCLDSLQVLAIGDVGNILRYVDPHRASMLAGGYHQRITDRSRALLLLYVSLILVTKVLDGGEYRVRAGLAQTTQRALLDRAGNREQRIKVVILALALGDAG